MARLFSDYTAQFFWNFKRMDNVNYNFEILDALYTAKKDTEDRHFNKPIILIVMSIIECMLYDFLDRIRRRSTDPLPNIKFSIIAYIQGSKDTDELREVIKQVKSQNLLLATAGDTIYSDLEQLRKVRNRIHIQNKYDLLNKNEYDVFTNVETKKAEICLERVCEVLCNSYPRGSNNPIPMDDFPRPWL